MRKRGRRGLLIAALCAGIAVCAGIAAIAAVLPRPPAADPSVMTAGGEDAAALARVWPESAVLMGSTTLVPFLFPAEHPDWFEARYVADDESRKHVSLSMRFTPRPEGNYGGWGVIFRGAPADWRRVRLVGLHLKAKSGQVFEFKVKDTNGAEVAHIVTIPRNGWQEVEFPIPLGVNLERVENFSFGFNDGLGAAEIFVDSIRFLR